MLEVFIRNKETDMVVLKTLGQNCAILDRYIL